MDVEDLLRGHFADQALDSPDPSPDLLPRAFARQRARRRHNTVVGAVVLTCAAVVVALIPVISAARGPESMSQVAAPGDASLLDTPTRGSLATDARFISALTMAPWPRSTPEQRHVAFVGDVPGGRWALVLGQREGMVVGQWFIGPADATPEQLTADTSSQETAGGSAFTHLEPTAPTSPLVVVAAPNQTVEVSQRAVVAADGTVSRDYELVSSTDGVAVVLLDGQTREGTESAARYRLVTDGSTGPSAPVRASGGGSTFDPPTLTPLRTGSGTPSPEAVDLALTQIGAPTGLEDDELSPQLLWAGPSTNGAETIDIAIVVGTLPSGALAVSTAWSQIAADGSGTASTCGNQVHPVGTRVENLTVVADCPGVPGARADSYVVSVPAADLELTLGADDGTNVAVTLDGQNVLRTDLPSGLTVGLISGPVGPGGVTESVRLNIAQPSPDDVFDRAGE